MCQCSATWRRLPASTWAWPAHLPAPALHPQRRSAPVPLWPDASCAESASLQCPAPAGSEEGAPGAAGQGMRAVPAVGPVPGFSRCCLPQQLPGHLPPPLGCGSRARLAGTVTGPVVTPPQSQATPRMGARSGLPAGLREGGIAITTCLPEAWRRTSAPTQASLPASSLSPRCVPRPGAACALTPLHVARHPNGGRQGEVDEGLQGPEGRAQRGGRRAGRSSGSWRVQTWLPGGCARAQGQLAPPASLLHGRDAPHTWAHQSRMKRSVPMTAATPTPRPMHSTSISCCSGGGKRGAEAWAQAGAGRHAAGCPRHAQLHRSHCCPCFCQPLQAPAGSSDNTGTAPQRGPPAGPVEGVVRAAE